MKYLLATTAILAAMSLPAAADTITLKAFVDGVLVSTLTSADGNLDVSAQSFGPDFNINSLTLNSETFLPVSNWLSTNTLNVNQSIGGNHQLVIDIVANGLAGPGAVVPTLSSFSVTGLTKGWNADEQTFINGSLLSDTGVFTATSDSAFDVALANLTNPFSAEAKYTINGVGVGRFNGGIDILAAPTPLPGTFPFLAAGLVGIAGLVRKRRSNRLA
jgi:hypothetical protein